MDQYPELKAADEARRKAMIEADLETLTSLFHPDLSWTHSSGRTDDRDALLASIADGGVVYQSLIVNDARVSQQGDVYVVNGILDGDVLKEGTPKKLNNKFLSVWLRSDDGYQMLAWQSTGF